MHIFVSVCIDLCMYTVGNILQKLKNADKLVHKL